MTFVIEKNIPIPEKLAFTPRGRMRKYPFADMAVNDSFIVLVEGDDKNGVQKMRASLHRSSRGYGKFSTRKVEGGVRIWRIE